MIIDICKCAESEHNIHKIDIHSFLIVVIFEDGTSITYEKQEKK